MRYILQDTLVSGGQVYQKVELVASGICSVLSGLPNACPLFNTAQNGVGVRTDTVTGQVFIYQPGAPEELLYDYSLNPGDTLSSFAVNQYNGPVVIDSVDTVVLGGFSRKRQWITTSLNQAPAWIIEGIGSSAGLVGWLGEGINAEREELVCYSEFGLPLVTNMNLCGSQTDCDQVASRDDFRDIGLKVWPNPAQDRVRLRWTDGLDYEIRFRDLLGRLVRVAASYPGVHEIAVSLEGLQPGLYLVEMVREGEPVQAIKLRLE